MTDGKPPTAPVTWSNDSDNVSGDVISACGASWDAGGGVDPETVEFIAPIAVLIVFNLVVVVGNILVIVAVSTHTKLRTVTNVFIISLAVADLMLGVTVLPFSSANEVLRYWPFGIVWCNIWLAIDVWLCTASILSLVAISMDRYLAISRPFKYPRLMSQTRARVLVTSVWAVSFIICFPPLIGWKEDTVAMDTGNVTKHVISKLFAIGENTTLSSWTGDAYMQNKTGIYYLESYEDSRYNNSGSNGNGADVMTADVTLGGVTSSPCYRTSELVCELTSEPGYIIYSALGSFWIPVWIMTFFYWKIYRAAVKTSSAIRRGVLTTKTSYTQNSSDSEVTLRVHRGGGGGSTKVRHKVGDDVSPDGRMLHTQLTPASMRRTSQPSRQVSRQSSCAHVHVPASPYSPGGDSHVNGKRKPSLDHKTNKSGFFSRTKTPRVRITFSKSKPNGLEFSSIGERQPLKPAISDTRTSGRHADQNGSRYRDASGSVCGPEESSMCRELEETSICMDETSTDGRNSTGFLNRVSRIQLRTHMRRMNKEKKAAKTVGIIVGCFIFCWAPFFTVYLLGAFCPGCTPEILFTIFFWLGYCNSAVNPFLYAMCSKDFRYAFKKLLRCRVERQRIERTGTRFVNFINSIKIQISTQGSDSNSE